MSLKGQECLYRTCFFQAVGQAAIATAIFNNCQWEKASRCSSSSIMAVFHTSDLLFLPQSEIRAGKLLVGHLQEEHLGGCPHHHYRRACCHRPIVGRVLQKTHILLMTMGKNYLKRLSLSVLPAYGYIELALVKCSNDGGPGPRHNMKGDPRSSIFSMLVVYYLHLLTFFSEPGDWKD